MPALVFHSTFKKFAFFFSCTVAAGKAVLKYLVFSRLSVSLNIVKIALEPGN